MIEMNDMVMDSMRTHNHVSDVLGILGNFHAECIFNRTH